MQRPFAYKSQNATCQPITMFLFFPSPNPTSFRVRPRNVRANPSGVTIRRINTDHNAGKGCEFCCGACQSWRYPSLLSLLVWMFVFSTMIAVGGIEFAHTHFELGNCEEQPLCQPTRYIKKEFHFQWVQQLSYCHVNHSTYLAIPLKGWLSSLSSSLGVYESSLRSAGVA